MTTPTDQLIEAMARALCAADGHDPDRSWTFDPDTGISLDVLVPEGEDFWWCRYRRKAYAAYAELERQGWRWRRVKVKLPAAAVEERREAMERRREALAQRRADIALMMQSGHSSREVGAKFKVSRGRVWQIYYRWLRQAFKSNPERDAAVNRREEAVARLAAAAITRCSSV